MSTFGKRLKEMRKLQSVSQKELAEAIGVGQTTIANYETDLRFPNQKRLNEFADYFNVSVDYLLGRFPMDTLEQVTQVTLTPKEIADLNRVAGQYIDLLRRGQRHDAKDLLLHMARMGVSFTHIYEHVLTFAMHKTGYMWETGQLGVDEEHYISAITEEIISLMYGFIRRSQVTKGKALIMPIHGEAHLIASKMIRDYFETDGWETYSLGLNTPSANVIRAIQHMKPDVLLLSITMKGHLEAAKTLIQTIRSYPDISNVKIMVGGQAFVSYPQAWKEIGADGYTQDFNESVTMANGWLKRS